MPNSIGVVIPCYLGGDTTLKLISEILIYANKIVLVDDNCPLKTGEKVLESDLRDKIHVIFNNKNLGVGASTKKGFNWLISQKCNIILKMDADYQMYPSDIPRMCEPIMKRECQATKGNRFFDIDNLLKMPKIRLIGNTFLNYLSKFSTGYWDISDPTNGFLAFDLETLKKIDFHKTDNRFFFETEILFRCSIKNINIINVPIEANYKNHLSSLSPIKEIIPFFLKNIRLLFKRIIYQYFLFDFNIGSIELIFSVIFSFSSILLGSYLFLKSYITYKFSSPGMVSIFTILSIFSLQFLLAFVHYDSSLRFKNKKN